MDVRLPKVVLGEIKCLFFGRWGLIMPLRLKKGGHPLETSYGIHEFESAHLEAELGEVEDCLGVGSDNSIVYRLPAGVYVHIYGSTIRCSELKLSNASPFFTYVDTSLVTLPRRNASMDIMPFVFGGDDLAAYTDSRPEVEYKWLTERSVSWDWNEDVWVARLAQCLETSSQRVRVIHAYEWKPKMYESNIPTLFPNVMKLRPTPFNGMTDLLLGHREACVIHTGKPSVLCSLKVGKDEAKTCPITIGGRMKM